MGGSDSQLCWLQRQTAASQSPQAKRGTEGLVGGLICKASGTWTLWNGAIG